MAFVVDGGDAVWVGAAKDPKKIVREIGVMQHVQDGQATPALDRASIVFQQVCHAKQAHAVEARAHELLADARVHRSWFECSAQTAIVKKPENSNLRRSEEWAQSSPSAPSPIR